MGIRTDLLLFKLLNIILSHTFILSKSASFSKTIPIELTTALNFLLSSTEILFILISPLEILTRPIIDFKRVLLPDKPLPTMHFGILGFTSKEILFNIFFLQNED